MIIGQQPILISGGADGSDQQWGMCAGMAGHQVIHFGFPGHGMKVPKPEQVRLTLEQLAEADPFVIRANRTLGRTFPGSSDYSNNLLRRNYYAQRDTQSLYAVIAGFDEHRRVLGGTAWAIQMFVDRHDDGPCPVYVFDQSQDGWFTYLGAEEWERIERPPTPTGVWTGIGCRARGLLANGKAAIRDLLGYQAASATG
ncbi:MAG: hypothetical protein EON55_12740 [Alphaproteobacteria bacterium]|nr:MAG: hypothetical protein EON55_12740 [Alphaproteobacteria bacterium]